MAEDSWYDRYAERAEDYRLPQSKTAREAYTRQVGEDGFKLMDALENSSCLVELKHLPKVEILRKPWERHYERQGEKVRWRDKSELGRAAQTIESPEAEARYSSKRGHDWVGYKVHLSESCNEDSPHLIVNGLTTAATEQDVSCTTRIQQGLRKRKLTPKAH